MEGNSQTNWNTSNNFTYVFSILIKKIYELCFLEQWCCFSCSIVQFGDKGPKGFYAYLLIKILKCIITLSGIKYFVTSPQVFV